MSPTGPPDVGHSRRTAKALGQEPGCLRQPSPPFGRRPLSIPKLPAMAWPVALLTLALCRCSTESSHPDDLPSPPAATSRVSTANGTSLRGRRTESHPPTHHGLSFKASCNGPTFGNNPNHANSAKKCPRRAGPSHVNTPERRTSHPKWQPPNDRNWLSLGDRPHSAALPRL